MRTVLESPESSSPIITRAIAAGIRGEYCEVYEVAPWQRFLLGAVGCLPQDTGRILVSRFQSLSGLPPERLEYVSIESIAQARLQDYAGLDGTFPAILTGAGLGGAAVHLGLALKGLFLPQTFVFTLRGGSFDGDVNAYFQRSAGLACRIAQREPSLLTIQHYDPVHDGWVTRFANHLRLKLFALPQAYRDFIRQKLEPGGAVVYLNCDLHWLRYRVGERSVFQVGGWGGIPADEYLEGSERLRRYCHMAGLTHSSWQLPGYPLEDGPESEWGAEPAYGAALADFCRREGYQFLPISLPEPHDFSRLAFEAVALQLAKEGRHPSGIFVEMFSQFDATAVQKGSLLPLWLVFNTHDSLAFLKEMIPRFPAGLPVFFSPLSTFSLTPDIVPWQEWAAALNGLDWHNVGTRPSHYPADTLALTGWAAPLHRWVAAHERPIRSLLSAAELQELATGMRRT